METYNGGPKQLGKGLQIALGYQLVEKVIKIKVHSHLSPENERLRLHWEVYRNALFHLLLMAVE